MWPCSHSLPSDFAPKETMRSPRLARFAKRCKSRVRCCLAPISLWVCLTANCVGGVQYTSFASMNWLCAAHSFERCRIEKSRDGCWQMSTCCNCRRVFFLLQTEALYALGSDLILKVGWRISALDARCWDAQNYDHKNVYLYIYIDLYMCFSKICKALWTSNQLENVAIFHFFYIIFRNFTDSKVGELSDDLFLHQSQK